MAASVSPRAEVNALYARLIPALTGADAAVTLSLANSIRYHPELAPKREFLDLNRSTFDAEAAPLDFASPAAVPALNAWVSEKTRGLIPVIAEAPLDADLVMMLLNALYFKGSWSRQFDPEATYPGDFHLADGTVKPCPMMTANGTFAVFHDPAADGLVLPYGDSLYAMVLMQPPAGTGMDDLVGALEAGALDTWLRKAEQGKGPIHVPRFKLEYGTRLKEALTALGMGPAFSFEADFSGIQEGLAISEVIHKTAVQVDERGTEAAAVTRVDVVRLSLPSELMRFDRPFVFAIREKTSGAVIFLGRIMDPTR
jgi:serpin B